MSSPDDVSSRLRRACAMGDLSRESLRSRQSKNQIWIHQFLSAIDFGCYVAFKSIDSLNYQGNDFRSGSRSI